MFYLVINHFEPAQAEAHLQASTLFSAALAVRAAEVATVLVVDGSERPNEELRDRLAQIGARYHHSGERLGFAQGYNAGLALSDQPWTILCASDVYASLTLFPRLAAFCQASGPQIGCVIPRLSFSDLPLQMDWVKMRRPVTVPLMTLNFNAFPTEYLRSIGGVPDEFTGNYNDVLLCDRIRADGRKIVMLPERCVHYGSLTIGSSATSVSQQRDRDRLIRTHPEMFDEHGFWHLDLRRFADSRALRMVLTLTTRLYPKRWRRPLSERAMRYLTRYRLN